MPDAAQRRFEYRGNFEVLCEVDYSGSLLRAEYGGGYRETVIIPRAPNGLRVCGLKYSALTTRALFHPTTGEPVSRFDYVHAFFAWSKTNGDAPFIMAFPLDGKDYLWVFKEDKISYTMIDHYLRTTGLVLMQTYVRGVSFLSDGSMGGEEPPNPDVI